MRDTSGPIRLSAAAVGALAGLTNWPPWYLALAVAVLGWGAWEPHRDRRRDRTVPADLSAQTGR